MCISDKQPVAHINHNQWRSFPPAQNALVCIKHAQSNFTHKNIHVYHFMRQFSTTELNKTLCTVLHHITNSGLLMVRLGLLPGRYAHGMVLLFGTVYMYVRQY